MTTGRFHGAFTALVTPFKNGKIDEEAVSYTHLTLPTKA